MTNDQEQHLATLMSQMGRLLNDKYRRGAKEHEGNLLDMTPSELIDEALAECMDQLTYLLTVKQKLSDFKDKYGDPLPKTTLRPLPDFPASEVLSETED